MERKPLTQTEAEQAKELWASGVSITRIAERIGRGKSYKILTRHIRENPKDFPPRKQPKPYAKTNTTYAHPIVQGLFRILSERGISVTEFCDQNRISRSAMNKWASGVIPNLVALMRCLDILGHTLIISPVSHKEETVGTEREAAQDLRFPEDSGAQW